MNKCKINPFKRSTWRPDYRTPAALEEQRICRLIDPAGGFECVGSVGAATMAELGDLHELMTDTDAAEALAQVRPRPGDWPEWVVILLRELERQAMEIELDHPEYYELALERLGDTIADRLSERKWPPGITSPATLGCFVPEMIRGGNVRG